MCLWTSKYWRVNTGHLIRIKSPKVPVPCLRGYIHVWVCIYMCNFSYFLHCLPLHMYVCVFGVYKYMFIWHFLLHLFILFLLYLPFTYVCVCLSIYIYIYKAYTYMCFMALLFTISFSSQFFLFHNTKVNLKSILSSDVCSNPTLC